jgi:hypothetical protein
MEWHGTINFIFSCLGIALFLYSLLIIRRIKRLFPKAKIMKYWVICSFFIVFFVIGYIVNIFAIIYDISILNEIFESIFVVGVLATSHLTYRLIKKSIQD